MNSQTPSALGYGKRLVHSEANETCKPRTFHALCVLTIVPQSSTFMIFKFTNDLASSYIHCTRVTTNLNA